MEHRYRILQEEKMREEKTAKMREDEAIRKNDSSQSEILRMNRMLNEKENILKDIEHEIAIYKRLSEEKTDEVIHLKGQAASASGESAVLIRDKKMTESELVSATKEKTSAEMEVEKLALENKRLGEMETDARLQGVRIGEIDT